MVDDVGVTCLAPYAFGLVAFPAAWREHAARRGKVIQHMDLSEYRMIRK
jgi:hypothetical protein